MTALSDQISHLRYIGYIEDIGQETSHVETLLCPETSHVEKAVILCCQMFPILVKAFYAQCRTWGLNNA